MVLGADSKKNGLFSAPDDDEDDLLVQDPTQGPSQAVPQSLLSQVAQLAGLQSPPRREVSLLSHSDEEDDDEVLSQAQPPAPAALVFSSQRVVDHPLPPSLSTPRPRTTSTASTRRSSSRSSGLPSRNEAESEKKFDEFIRLRVSTTQAESAGDQAPAPPQAAAAPESPRPGTSGQNLRSREGRSEESSQRQDEPLGPRVYQAVLEALQESRKPPVPRSQGPAVRSQDSLQLRQEAPVVPEPGLQSTAATAAFVASSYDDDDATSSVDSSAQPDPNVPPAVVPATVDGAGPEVVQAASALPPDVAAQAPVVPVDDAAAEVVQEDHRPRSSRRRKTEEESSFPTRFSPRKTRGMSHKYADTYYY